MKILKLTPQSAVETIGKHIIKQSAFFAYGIFDDTYVSIGSGKYVNENYISQHNIPRLKFENWGGTIVMSAGDIQTLLFSPHAAGYAIFTFNRLKEFLTSKGYECDIVDNDLIVDKKYKIAAANERVIQNSVYSTVHISVGMNLDLIKNICTKPMKKIPKGLSEFGITTDDMEQVILDSFYEFVKQRTNTEQVEKGDKKET